MEADCHLCCEAIRHPCMSLSLFDVTNQKWCCLCVKVCVKVTMRAVLGLGPA